MLRPVAAVLQRPMRQRAFGYVSDDVMTLSDGNELSLFWRCDQHVTPLPEATTKPDQVGILRFWQAGVQGGGFLKPVLAAISRFHSLNGCHRL
jgi:hypothetical protein